MGSIPYKRGQLGHFLCKGEFIYHSENGNLTEFSKTGLIFMVFMVDGSKGKNITILPAILP